MTQLGVSVDSSVPGLNASASDPIRLGLLGLGHWGRKLAEAVGEWGDLAVASSTGGSAGRDWLQRALPHTRYVTCDEVLYDSTLTGVFIATPRSSHADLTSKALRAGKHVFVEKPLSDHPAGSAELVDLANQSGLVLDVDYTHLHDLSFRKLSGYGEQISDAELKWDRPGLRSARDVLWEIYPHVCSMAHALDPAMVVLDARVRACLGISSVEVRFGSPTIAFGAVAAIDALKRKKYLAANLGDGDSLVWTDLQLILESGGTSELLSAGQSVEPIRLAVMGFIDRIRARRSATAPVPLWSPASDPAAIESMLGEVSKQLDLE